MSIVFGYISACSQLLILEVFGKEVCFHIQKEDAENFYRVHNRRGQQEAEQLSLEVGERYEDESGLFWDIMRSSKEIFVGINNQTIRDFNADGKYAPCNLMDYTHGKNLVRKVPPVAAPPTLAEELYEKAAKVHSIENQVGYIKVAARRAAREGKFSLYLDIVNFPLSNQEKAYELLRSDGFTIKDNYLRWGKE